MDSKINKLQPKFKAYVFIRYVMDYKGHRCIDLVTNKVFISRHVLFHEHKFPYRTLVGSSVPYTYPSILNENWSPTTVSCCLP